MKNSNKTKVKASFFQTSENSQAALVSLFRISHQRPRNTALPNMFTAASAASTQV
jgi:hypothetical protein